MEASGPKAAEYIRVACLNGGVCAADGKAHWSVWKRHCVTIVYSLCVEMTCSYGGGGRGVKQTVFFKLAFLLTFSSMESRKFSQGTQLMLCAHGGG